MRSSEDSTSPRFVRSASTTKTICPTTGASALGSLVERQGGASSMITIEEKRRANRSTVVAIDSCFYTANDLRSFGLPVLGGISLTSHGPRRAAMMPAITFGFGVVLLVFMFGAFITGPHWFAAMPGSHWLARFV